MRTDLILMLHGGVTPSQPQQSASDFKAQYRAYNDALRQMRDLDVTFCQAIYDHFGPRGDFYRNVLAKPSEPYSPYRLH